jgi:hypothetical protein
VLTLGGLHEEFLSIGALFPLEHEHSVFAFAKENHADENAIDPRTDQQAWSTGRKVTPTGELPLR